MPKMIVACDPFVAHEMVGDGRVFVHLLQAFRIDPFTARSKSKFAVVFADPHRSDKLTTTLFGMNGFLPIFLFSILHFQQANRRVHSICYETWVS